MVKIKVCGMKNAANIAEVSQLKPDYLGFIFYPGSKRFVGNAGEEVLAEINKLATVVRTGVFVNDPAEVVLDRVKEFRLDAVQLHGGESPETCLQVKDAGLKVIKAFGLDETFDFTLLAKYEQACDYFLFDTKTSSHGGSGKAFNWKLLEKYTLDKPYFLSGGLGPENIEQIQSINDERFYAVDLNSKFEIEPGIKDVQKLEQAFKRLKQQSI
ncbi:MAG TPA: phosphoribosylanthranilate isomerase [Sphingobacteriaceae bacterium]